MTTFEILPDDAPVKLCRDCKHYQPMKPQCRAPGNEQQDYVEGGKFYEWHNAQNAREVMRSCGPTAEWFEPIAPAD
jgi:hypothetical protein